MVKAVSKKQNRPEAVSGMKAAPPAGSGPRRRSKPCGEMKKPPIRGHRWVTGAMRGLWRRA
jgi:hypothetical protein